jgi:hypothetical protein
MTMSVKSWKFVGQAGQAGQSGQSTSILENAVICRPGTMF